MRRWQIVLISPQEPGNVGGAARVLKNFGAGGLRVVAPRCEVNSPDARRFSSGAAEILRGAPIYDSLEDAIADCQLAIGLSGVGGKHHKLDCIDLVPETLLRGRESIEKCALVFGREDRGMTGDEMEKCSFLWSLPTQQDFPSLNLAQAIGITLAAVAEAERRLGLAELGRGLAPSDQALNPLGGSRKQEDQPAELVEIDRMLARLEVLMKHIGWPEGRRLRNSVSKVRNLYIRGQITTREVAMFHGIYGQALDALEHPERYAKSDEEE